MNEDLELIRAALLVLATRKGSTSYLQRHLGLAYLDAAKLMDRLEGAGLVSGANDAGKRDILFVVENLLPATSGSAVQQQSDNETETESMEEWVANHDWEPQGPLNFTDRD